MTELRYLWRHHRARHHLYRAWLAWTQHPDHDHAARYQRADQHLEHLETRRP